MNNILDEKELIKILTDFYDKDFSEASSEEQKKYIESYRKVEIESNKQIRAAGGVENWYASGQGRMI